MNKKITIKNIKNNIYYINNKKLFQQLIKLINSNTRRYASMLQGKKNSNKRSNLKYEQLNNWINLSLPELNKPIYNIKTKCYWIIHNIISFNDVRVKCQHCKKPYINKNVKNIFLGYSTRGYNYSYCCSNCAKKSKQTREKSKNTCLKKYGVKFSFQSENNKQKTKQFYLKKYNTTFYVKSDEFKNKSKKTKYDKYNDKFYNNRKKYKETCLKKYGVDHPMKNKKINKKANQTYFKKTGYYFPAQNPDVQKNIIRRYKYNNIFFMSYPELAYYIYLKDHNFIFEFQPKDKVIKYSTEHIDGKIHIYYPDFYIYYDSNGNKVNELHEIKGNNQFKNYDINNTMIDINNSKLNYKAEAKHKCMIKNNVKILTYKDYIIFQKYVEQKYGKNFKEQLKIKKV